MILRVSSLFTAAMLLSTVAAAPGNAPPPPAAGMDERTREMRGLAFAQTHCAGCHAVETGTSPNPEAPPFEAVINKPGLNMDTLKPWLSNSHDFPAVMDFSIDPEQVDDLAAYMLTLKSVSYRPDI